jgi:methylated-DNA-[protein]-cysteine S-methyltransferase
MSKIKSPAYKNMTKEQLEASIELGGKILRGEADLVELDNRSLEVRGKGKNGSGRVSGKIDSTGGTEKRKMEHEEKNAEVQEKRVKVSPPPEEEEEVEVKRTTETKEDLTRYLKKIALSSKTDFQKKVLTTLCQVPRGKYSTYGAMAKHLNSSPRAVGNALRNNPFAPHVPCHRILASGGGLGGFHGSWGRKGKEGLHDDKKRRFLRDEGVRFDGKGMVVGSPWEGFT